MSAPVLAWHFLPADRRLRVDSPIPEHRCLLVEPGQVLTCDPGKLALCSYGLHASERALDALEYAPGPVISRAECGGEIRRDDDKLVCSERRVLWVADATEALRVFARWCALRAVRAHWPKAPAVVVEYLETGDEPLRAAARATAGGAERAAQAEELERRLLALAPKEDNHG